MASKYDDLINKIWSSFNFSFSIKPLQKVCLENILEGRDVYAVLPTGYGKTILYTVLPKLLREFDRETNGKSTSCQRDFYIVLVISPLVSLMKDQLVCIDDYGVGCVYLGDQHDEDTLRKIHEGNVPVLLMSPESLFSGNWRELLTTPIYQEFLKVVIIDEAHCVEQWGEDFRQDYARISELRSIVPNAVMLALTATATSESRKKISSMLGMNNYCTVLGCCDRPNIMYICQKSSYDIKENFQWLIDEVKLLQTKVPKSIIYCRNIKSCSLLYSLFRNELGSEWSYRGHPSAKNCLFAMYHHSTPNKNKTLITEIFRQDSVLRVVISTTAFGMGVNVPDIRRVIHWGASKCFSGFMQESGRAGRDHLPSHSIMYFHPVDISATATDKEMHNFCTTTECRRKYLVNHFSPENMFSKRDVHTCCDICAASCKCGLCPDTSWEFLSHNENKWLLAASTVEDMNDKPYRELSQAQIIQIRHSLESLRISIIEDMAIHSSVLNIDVLTGISESVISDIVHNAHYIMDVEDILSDYAFDVKTATLIMQIIDSA